MDLELAEEKIMCFLQAASAAFRSLATVQSSQAGAFDSHAEQFLTNLADAQQLMGKQISQLGPYIPFENGSMRKLIEADIAVQKVAHVHLALQRALRSVDVPAVTQSGGPSSGKFESGQAASSTLLVSTENNDPAVPVADLQADLVIDGDFGMTDTTNAMDLVG